VRTYLTVKSGFSAAHRLHRPDWSLEKNQEVFGLCSNPNGHGHNYEIEVTIEGDIDLNTGMILDMKALKALIQREILERVDHKNLNVDVPFLEGIIPTAEVLAVAFWEILVGKIPAGELYEVRVHETGRNVAIARR
jgi:6-pyruvoyltetrahydropterin/6-carboxytetrahydropterin synthase